MKDNLIICVSSFNNYEMLENEVLKNIKFEGFEFINIDDKSTPEQLQYGKDICNKYKLGFIENQSKGIQWATQTVMEHIKENRPNCKWVLMFQHDNFPVTKDFFKRLSDLFSNPENDLSEIAAFGFNNLDAGEYTGDAGKRWEGGMEPLGLLGKFHLSGVGNKSRWAAPVRNTIISREPPEFKKPFSIEIPLEASMAINIDKWFEFITPTTDYEFHLWFPDVMMQFLKQNQHCVILPDMYCVNNQYLKPKYGIAKSSASGALNGQEHLFGEYGPHLKNWIKRWGWDYENTRETFPRERYKGTLIDAFFNHDLNLHKPLRNFNLKY